MPGTGTWAAAHAKAVALVSQMTLQEKANITVGWTTDTGCSGVTGSVPRLNWPGLCLSDAGNGLRNTDYVNGWPSGLHVGAAWDRNLAYQRALHMGAEFKTKGVNVALGPVVAPLGRMAEGGRNWEGISNDREYSNWPSVWKWRVDSWDSIPLWPACLRDGPRDSRSRRGYIGEAFYRLRTRNE